MSKTHTIPGLGKLRVASQRRYILASCPSQGKPRIEKRSDSADTLRKFRRSLGYSSTMPAFYLLDSVTGESERI